MIDRWIILAGEEAGPSSNKMGGIWNVIDAEAKTLARLSSEGAIDKNARVVVAGPYYPSQGSDWNTGKNRVTDISGYEKLNLGSELDSVLSGLKASGIEAETCQREIDGVTVAYLLFNTTYYQSRMVRWKGEEMTLNNAIKTEAYSLIGLDSMRYERLQDRKSVV